MDIRKFWYDVLASIVGVVLAGLVLGFFSLLYHKSTQTDDLYETIEKYRDVSQATDQALTKELSELKLEVQRLHSDHVDDDSVKALRSAEDEIQQSIDKQIYRKQQLSR